MPSPTDEQIAEDVMNNDIDPMEGIRSIRREEGVSEDDLPPAESEVMADVTDDEDTTDDEEVLPGKEEADESEKEEVSADDQAAADAATVADAAVAAADKAADKAAGKEVDEDDDKELPDAGDDKDEEPASESTTFKANGQEFTFTNQEMIDQFSTVFGQSMNYTQKMQKIAPYRKMISALEQEGVTHDTLNVALDALKGDKGALKKMMEMAKVDAYDLTSDDDDAKPYVATNYGKDEKTLDIEEITSKISGDEEFKITTNVIDEQWDDASRRTISENPQIITGLHNDIVSGMYDTVAPIAMKMKVLDGHSKSDLEYYMLAGEQVGIKMAADEKAKTGQKSVDDLNKGAQDADSKFDKASSEAERKRAASSTGKRADRKGVVDYLDDDDEAYDAWYAKIHAG
jgi:hypothetical protein